MYFGRYIWNYIERVYLKRAKKNEFFEYTSKFPTVIIPRMFLNNYEKMIKYSKIYRLKKSNFLLKKSLYSLSLKSIIVLLSNGCKFLVLKNYYYSNNYNLLLKFTKYRKIFYYKMYDLFLSIHNGHYYYRLNIPNIRLTLSVFVETITYGSREAKKKKKEQNKKKKKVVKKKAPVVKKKAPVVQKKKK